MMATWLNPATRSWCRWSRGPLSLRARQRHSRQYRRSLQAGGVALRERHAHLDAAPERLEVAGLLALRAALRRAPSRPGGCTPASSARTRCSTRSVTGPGPTPASYRAATSARRREPGCDGGGEVVGDHVVARLRRRREEIADVGERVAERAQLPVEHREHGAVLVDDAVPEPQVAVHDAALVLLRDALGQELVDLLDAGQVVRLRLLVLPVPSAELAADVVVLLREVAESDRVDVDRVERDVRVDDALARVAARRPRRACATAVPTSLSTMPSTYSIT